MSASPPPTTTPDSVPIDLGDLVDSDHEADIEAESEDTLEYFSGYFYPVSIGDLLKQHYQIVHKLGRGGFSTVGKAVALKILCSSASSDDEYEAHIDIAQRVRDRSRLVLCQDQFVLIRMHRNVEHKHRVLVLPLRGPSLHMGFQGIQTPLAHRMSAARHLLQAILSIHEAGLVHRDIVPRNVVYSLNADLGKMSITDKYKLLGRPRKGRIFEEDEVVGEIVAPAEFPLRVLGSDAYLCDFGILVKAGTSVPNKLQSPAGYCAPKLFHDI
ncbi:hypothetical protein Daus18300_010599 [Diaporthe australafricana]|uniref:Protein kinase domain-containing protein n=1 Tax=Diaporthe australafricana TaxID=127596 RepID=A0ABR3W9Q3_9PEZI